MPIIPVYIIPADQVVILIHFFMAKLASLLIFVLLYCLLLHFIDSFLGSFSDMLSYVANYRRTGYGSLVTTVCNNAFSITSILQSAN